ncbi:MAG: hypothetical protein R3F30_10475 [Planctomycetota bacterium]
MAPLVLCVGRAPAQVKSSLLQDLNKAPSLEDADPAEFTELGALVCFSASTTAEGRELWRVASRSNLAIPVKILEPGPGSSSPTSLRILGQRLLFFARTGGRWGLWQSDATADGTAQLLPLSMAGPLVGPRFVARLGNLMFFVVHDGRQDRELWVTAGTAASTVRIHLAPLRPDPRQCQGTRGSTSSAR